MKKKLKKQRGFTLIEILIVLGIIAILLVGIILAVNPGRQFAQARNTQRWSDVNAILNAVYQRMVDNRGSFAEGTTCDALPTSAAKTISSTPDAANVNLCSCLAPDYLGSIPFDPNATGASYTDCSNYHTAYTIIASSTTNRITVTAPSAELGTTISISR